MGFQNSTLPLPYELRENNFTEQKLCLNISQKLFI